VLYRDGVAIAALVGGKPTALIELSAADTQLAKHALLRYPPSLPEMPAAAR
jgi:ATP-dependent Lhr-like helicase